MYHDVRRKLEVMFHVFITKSISYPSKNLLVIFCSIYMSLSPGNMKVLHFNLIIEICQNCYSCFLLDKFFNKMYLITSWSFYNLAELLIYHHSPSRDHRWEARHTSDRILCSWRARRQHKRWNMLLRGGFDQVQPQVFGWHFRTLSRARPYWTHWSSLKLLVDGWNFEPVSSSCSS